ncbi:hypothetical protein Y032_0934g3109 [Ancylostoma ceylanicum]|uniref:Uncharacterized protein n=1 Tax=Ancylostoma ceylanicum TaxID=53326 RepID=A0A016WA23_9BILA|nr:hypothetical protein Y032_0934g3109 [Ancylostoma ceylanicum]
MIHIPAKALSLYSESRVKDAHTIIDLAMYNYEELKDLVNHRSYKLRKKLDLFLNRIFSNRWLPLYSMVTFTRMPYHEIVEERKRQDKVLSRLRNSAVSMAALGALLLIYCGKKKHLF